MGYIRIYEGSIEDVLHSGEHDSGDGVLIDYDELFDLVEQAGLFAKAAVDPIEFDRGALLSWIERRTNRPIHPVLGGKSPYSEFLGL